MMRLSLFLARFGNRWNLFCWSAILCVAVPGFASLKAVVLLSFWLYLILETSFQLQSLLWFLSVLLQLTVWFGVASFHNVPVENTLNQTTRFLLFFIILSIGTLLRQSMASMFDHAARLDRLIAWVAILSASFKTAILIAVASGLATLDTVQSAIGFETVSDDIGFGLQRLQFPSDIILIFLIFSYSGGRRRALDFWVLVGITISTLLSFSRYLFAAYVVCLILRSSYLRKMDFISRLSAVLGILLAITFSVTLSARFVGEGAESSDFTRSEQITQLTGAILTNPFFGSGLGANVHGYTRSLSIPFSYEVQWYAMAMQLGLLGLLWFFLNVIPVVSLTLKSVRDKLYCAAFLALWIAAGFTNPFIISLGSAFGLCFLILRFSDSSSPAVRFEDNAVAYRAAASQANSREAKQAKTKQDTA